MRVTQVLDGIFQHLFFFFGARYEFVAVCSFANKHVFLQRVVVMRKLVLVLVVVGVLVHGGQGFAWAWDGYDHERGAPVEIERGNLVRPGQDIEIYDYSDGTYKDVEVQSIHGTGSGAEVEVYDHSTGEYRTLDMD